MNGFFEKRFFEHVDPYETGANPTESTQNKTPRIFLHAGLESDVKTLQIRHPDPKIKKTPPKDCLFYLFTRLTPFDLEMQYLEIKGMISRSCKGNDSPRVCPVFFW